MDESESGTRYGTLQDGGHTFAEAALMVLVTLQLQ